MGKGRGMLDGLRKSKKQKEAEKGAAAEKQERDQKRADEKVEEQTLSYQRHSDRPPNTLRITVDAQALGISAQSWAATESMALPN